MTALPASLRTVGTWASSSARVVSQSTSGNTGTSSPILSAAHMVPMPRVTRAATSVSFMGRRLAYSVCSRLPLSTGAVTATASRPSGSGRARRGFQRARTTGTVRQVVIQTAVMMTSAAMPAVNSSGLVSNASPTAAKLAPPPVYVAANWPESFQVSGPTAPDHRRPPTTAPAAVPTAPMPKAASIVGPAEITVRTSTEKRINTMPTLTAGPTRNS